jgi:dienelactone hydrolase
MPEDLIDSKKTMLIASDIFGLSDAFLLLLKEIGVNDEVIWVSPYQQPQPQFDNERQAYQCFQDLGGIDTYILRLTKLLKTYRHINQVVGFSAGAAAIYAAAASNKSMSNSSDNNIQLTLFYPGQIRHFFDQYPSCPCHIIFPESEPHFSVSDVIEQLKHQPQLQVEQSTYQHGFMNTDSKGFDQTAYNHYCQMLSAGVPKTKSR